jgi:hypothetical protein
MEVEQIPEKSHVYVCTHTMENPIYSLINT